MLDEDIQSQSSPVSREQLGDDSKHSSELIEKKSVFSKSSSSGDTVIDRAYEPEEKLQISDTTGCEELIPGIYKINGQKNFYIEIINTLFNVTHKGKGIRGFLKYDDFFSVPVFRCNSVDKNFVFSLSRRTTYFLIKKYQFPNSNPIDYKIPKKKLIYETHTVAKLSPSLNFEEPHFNIGCSILYKSFFKNKSTFTLKGNTIINISHVQASSVELSQTRIYNIEGTITIAGETYSLIICIPKFDETNNDSQISYDKIGLHPRDYNFNILDFLPSITD